jgi:predicted RecB family nuclease
VTRCLQVTGGEFVAPFQMVQSLAQLPGQTLTTRPYMTDDDVRMLRSVGIHTIQDLADADKYTVLKLRG